MHSSTSPLHISKQTSLGGGMRGLQQSVFAVLLQFQPKNCCKGGSSMGFFFFPVEDKGPNSVWLFSAITAKNSNGFSLKHGHRQHIGGFNFTALILQKEVNPSFLEDFYIKNKF